VIEALENLGKRREFWIKPAAVDPVSVPLEKKKFVFGKKNPTFYKIFCLR
jgi:hypothetical protein